MLEKEKNGFNISFYFQGHWAFPQDKLMQEYAYILTHPGTVSPYNTISSNAFMISLSFLR